MPSTSVIDKNMAAPSQDERVLAVVIPAYNEEKTIEQILTKIDALPMVREIIVVDDGSKDNTIACVEAFDSDRIRLIRQDRNQGKTAAVRRGVSEVTSPLTIIQDADLEYDPEEIPFVIDPISRAVPTWSTAADFWSAGLHVCSISTTTWPTSF